MNSKNDDKTKKIYFHSATKKSFRIVKYKKKTFKQRNNDCNEKKNKD